MKKAFVVGGICAALIVALLFFSFLSGKGHPHPGDPILDRNGSYSLRLTLCHGLSQQGQLTGDQRRACTDEVGPAAMDALRREASGEHCEDARGAAKFSVKVDPNEVNAICERLRKTGH